jgi:4-diphosphocytidyl-2-C-methyl-D-erythritol kinase
VDGTELTKRPDIDGMTAALAAGDLHGVAARLFNVFEEALPPQYHEVFAIKQRMKDLGALNALMSGSGPSVFAIFEKAHLAEQAAETLKKTYEQTWIAKPVKKF